LALDEFQSIAPMGKTEIRISANLRRAELGWVLIEAATAEVSASAYSEKLRGKQIERYPRNPVDPAEGFHRWVTPAATASGRLLYFLNLGAVSTVMGSCQGTNPDVNCANIKPRLAVNPNASVTIQQNQYKFPYAIVESYQTDRSIVMYLSLGGGELHDFEAKSSVVFGSEVK
jgi:hypothetical protein